MLGVAALAVTMFFFVQAPVQAGDPWVYPRPPSYFGYPLDDRSAGYYGGGRYTEYYSYGRGYGIANYPGPLPGPGLPPDYRGPMPRPGTVYYSPSPEPPMAVMPAPQDSVAQLHVEVPADAEVWIEGQPTKQAGTTRWFVSPPLNKGQQFEYRIRARWTAAGRPVEQTQQITVKAGDSPTVRFPTEGKKDVLAPPKLFPLPDER
jgi:uncharacterized protein (TIGR03000 family)